MNQYGTRRTNFAAHDLDKVHFEGRTKTIEAFIGSSYGELPRSVRRRESKDAFTWYICQITTSSMPQQYHCGGYGK